MDDETNKPQPLVGENLFGGKNPNGLYVPMSEDEQEVLQRLVETQDLRVIVHGWGTLDNPPISFGDLRISIPLSITFNAPAVPQDVWFFDLELRSRTAGMTLVRQRQPTVVGGQPLQVVAGMTLEMIWDIALHHMSPEFVKAIKPGALGLTSRRIDRDTKSPTITGNMRLDQTQRETLHWMERGISMTQRGDVHRAVEVTKKAGYEVRNTTSGPVAPDLPEPKSR